MRAVTVIIPVKNQANSIGSALTAIRNQTVTPAEIVVVDGHSQDDIVGAVRDFPVTLVYENYGTRAGALMTAIQMVGTELVAFTDADCIPKNDWIERLLGSLDSGVVGVGGNVINVGDAKALRIVNAAFSSPLGSGSSIQGRRYAEAVDIKSISGSNSMYRVEAIRACGGFNVRLLGAEDAELNRRIRKFGRLVVSPDAIVYHNHGRGYKSFFRRMSHYGEARVLAGILSIANVLSVFVPVLLLAAIFYPLCALAIFLVYLIGLVLEGLRLSFVNNLDPSHSLLISGALLGEHAFYTIGTWKGIVRRFLRS